MLHQVSKQDQEQQSLLVLQREGHEVAVQANNHFLPSSSDCSNNRGVFASLQSRIKILDFLQCHPAGLGLF